MPTPRLALVVSAALVAGAFAVPSSAAAAPTTINGCVDSVPETDTLEAGPVKICYTLFKPATAAPDNQVPVVLHSHGWGGSRTTTASSFTKWLDAGIGVLSFDQRGFGESGGKAHVEDPAFEGQDTKRMVDVVAAQDWVLHDTVTTTTTVPGIPGKGKKNKGGTPDTTTTTETVDPRDPRVGAIGGSYGGGYQFVGAFTELMESGKTRFDALAPEITWFDLGESLAPRDVVRTAWVSALYAAGANAHTTTVHQGFAQGAATGQWPAEMAEFFKDNGPAYHVAQGRRLDIPVAFGQGITDNLFPLDQGLQNYDKALTPEARAKSLFIGYNGGHVLPSALPAGFGVAGDPCSKVVNGGTGSFSDVALRFMKLNLLGQDTGLTGFGRYHLATADGGCSIVDSVKPTTSYTLPTVATTTAAGAPIAWDLGAAGPLKVAGSPTLTATVTAAGVDTRAFFALSVGTTPADAQIVQNNTLPFQSLLPVVGQRLTIKLPSVAVDVPAGKKLFLTVSPVADMFGGHGSRTPGALVLQDVRVDVPQH
ncbi:MAG: peptidase [Frankiales bacterium]|jgi:ABC-2 type transport system ATP-binding protein|nr:peptidase [Frankiales bacterium]